VDSIQALLVDRDEDNLTALPERLRHPFAKLGWQVAWTTALDPAQVRELFAVPGAAYDLIVVELPGSQAGLNVIGEARERFPGAYILAVGDGDVDVQRPDLLEEARRSGAHRAVLRYEFSADARDSSPTAIATEIHNHLLDTGAVAPIAVTYDELDPDIQALVHEIGEPTLCRLYARILEAAGRTTRNMSLGYIATGYSGAAVCAVTAALDNSGVRTHHVLKVSLDKEALAREAERGAEAEALMRPALLVRQAPAYPVGPVNGWYALASQLQGSALTLRDWLARGAPEAAVEDVFAALFTDGLGGVYADTAREIDSPEELLRTPYHRQRRVVHAVKELSPVLTHPDGCRLPEPMVEELAEQLTAFVTDGSIGGILAGSMSQSTYGVYAHGDLHATNVLVYEGRHPEPTLIDASGFGYAHWAVDPARLAVDLLMYGVDPGVESMFFTGFDRWRQVAARLGRLEPLLDVMPDPNGVMAAAMIPAGIAPTLPDSGTSATELAAGGDPVLGDAGAGDAVPVDTLPGAGGAAALAALNWLTGNLRAFCPGLTGDGEYRAHAWEWHTALARNLMRASYDHEITVPKRALALVAAHDQIAAAAQGLPL
jgi:hypothetical protein